jgi:hypothetical protein
VDSSVIAYKINLSADKTIVTVQLREPTAKDLELSSRELFESVASGGWELSRVGVLAENLREYISSDGSTLEPLTLIKKGSDWVLIATTDAVIAQYMKIVGLEGGNLPRRNVSKAS